MKWWAWLLVGAVAGAAAIWVYLAAQAAAQQQRYASLHAADSVRHAQDSAAIALSLAESAQRDSALAATRDSAKAYHQATALLSAALDRADSAEGAAKLAVAAATTLKDTATTLIIALSAATKRADLAEQAVESVRREASLLASDTTLLRGQLVSAAAREGLLTADRDRYKTLADSATHLKPLVSGKFLGLIPWPRCVVGYGVAARNGIHDGVAVACGIPLGKP